MQEKGILQAQKGKSITKAKTTRGNIPVIAGGQSSPYSHNQANYDGNVITIAASGAAGFVWYHNYPIWASDCIVLKSNDENILLTKYLYYILKSKQEDVYQLQQGACQQHVYWKDFEGFIIPLVDINRQHQVVEELESYDSIIKDASNIINSYIPFFNFTRNYETRKINDLCHLVRGCSPRPKSSPKYYGGSINRLMVEDVTRDGMYVEPKIDFLTKEGAKLSREMKKGDVVMVVSGVAGLPFILAKDCYIHDGFVGFKDLDESIIPEFLYFVLLHRHKNKENIALGSIFENLTTEYIKNWEIPIISKQQQQLIINNLMKEQKLVKNQIETIDLFESKKQNCLSSLWNSKKQNQGNSKPPNSFEQLLKKAVRS